MTKQMQLHPPVGASESETEKIERFSKMLSKRVTLKTAEKVLKEFGYEIKVSKRSHKRRGCRLVYVTYKVYKLKQIGKWIFEGESESISRLLKIAEQLFKTKVSDVQWSNNS